MLIPLACFLSFDSGSLRTTHSKPDFFLEYRVHIIKGTALYEMDALFSFVSMNLSVFKFSLSDNPYFDALLQGLSY